MRMSNGFESAVPRETTTGYGSRIRQWHRPLDLRTTARTTEPSGACVRGFLAVRGFLVAGSEAIARAIANRDPGDPERSASCRAFQIASRSGAFAPERSCREVSCRLLANRSERVGVSATNVAGHRRPSSLSEEPAPYIYVVLSGQERTSTADTTALDQSEGISTCLACCR